MVRLRQNSYFFGGIAMDQNVQPNLMDSFVAAYSKDFSEYALVADKVKEKLSQLLKQAGIMAIVSARAKSPDRLKGKLERMQASAVADGKPPYGCEEDIWNAVHDLVGARIALYFPSDAQRIEGLLKEDFDYVSPIKVFPPKVPNHAAVEAKNCTAHMRKIYPGYDTRRFDGYHANHHSVTFQNPPTGKIRNPVIEIQVASVLMHAWSEVEHDLAYKKMMGSVSREEYECLDEINGLVIAGEIALNRLNQLSQQRIRSQERFDTSLELKAYLSSWLEGFGITEDASGSTYNVDQLFELYRQKDILTREQVDKQLKRLGSDQPGSMHDLVFQLMEVFYGDHPKLAKETVSRNAMRNADAEFYTNAKIGGFLGKWNALEALVRKALRAQGCKGSNNAITWRYMVEERKLSDPICELYYGIRLERNKIVHSNRLPGEEKFRQLEQDMALLTQMLKTEYGV